MPEALLQDIVRHCDRTLKIDEIADYDGAVLLMVLAGMYSH